MSATDAHSKPTEATDAQAGGHDDHHGHPNLAHHFDSLEQQYASDKLGMWVFLATEVLMFSGLFCAYAIYRAHHPEVFLFAAEKYLDSTLGALNTVVLLCSSFTMAWAVRASQLNQRKLCAVLLALTFLGGVMFMGVKWREYDEKFSHGVAPGFMNIYSKAFQGDASQYHHGDGEHSEPHDDGAHADGDSVDSHADGPQSDGPQSDGGHVDAQAEAGDGDLGDPVAAPPAPPAQPVKQASLELPHTTLAPPAAAPAGMKQQFADPGADAQSKPSGAPRAVLKFDELSAPEQERVASFFGIYFLMTGLHGIHVLVGMGLIAWIFVRTLRNDFSEKYFTPVDLVGLYWHLVDLIWIYLFPLLYLID